MPTHLDMNNLAPELQEQVKGLEAIVFDFDGVFTDNSVIVDQNGVESVRCWRSDGLGISRLRTLGISMLVLSTEINPVVSTRIDKLKLECKQGVDNKASVLDSWLELNGLNPKKTAFVGNDINDIVALEKVGLPIGVADSYPEILPYVKLICTKNGGYGAVREVCDLIYSLKTQD